MKVTINSKKGLKTELKVLIDKKTIKTKVDDKLDELKHKVNLKGFRPGKVPIEVLKRQFGKPVYGEVLETILRESTAAALKENKIKVAGQPKINIKNHGEDKDLEYLIEVDQLPDINIKKIEDIKITDYSVNISKKDTEDRLNDIAKNQKNFVDKKEGDVAQNGDLVIFDYKATINGKNFEGGEGKNTQIVLGQDLFIKGFDKQISGSKKYQEKTAEVVLPENYPNKEFSNKKAKFICKILNIKRSEKVEVNDKLAQNLGSKDLDDLREKITKQIQTEYSNTLNNLTKKEILSQLENFKDFQIPQSLIDTEVSILTQGMEKKEMEKNKNKNLEHAKKRIKVALILNELGEKNNLKVSEEELNSEITKQAQMMQGQAKQIIEYYKKNPSAMSNLQGGIYEDKIIALIKNKAKSYKKVLSIKEAEKLIINDAKKNQKDSSSSKTTTPKKTAKINKKTKRVSKK